MSQNMRTSLVSLAVVLIGYAVYGWAGLTGAVRGSEPVSPADIAVHSALPAPMDAKRILNITTRHREWAMVPVGQSGVLTWIVYPERSDKAPVIILTGEPGAPSDWVRAISDQLAAEGFIAVAPGGTATARNAEAVRGYAGALPSADGHVVTLAFDTAARRVHVSGTLVHPTRFALAKSSWPDLIAFLNHSTGNNPLRTVTTDGHAEHFAALMAGVQQSTSAAADGILPASQKRDDLPASILTAASALAHTRLRHEWVDIPTSTVKLHTWVSYPAGNGNAGVVIVMQQAPGNDLWERALADQLAREGFIAVAPDLHSGLGPHGGGFDDFEFRDDVMRANARLNDDLRISFYRAARDWALKLPRANGKTASLGFCAGGSNSFRFAGDVPELNAAVVYYGGAPDETTMAKINAPVLGFYGDNDVRVTASVEPATAAMKKLGKSYESHIYKEATHAFVWYQEIGRNYEAMADAWPRTIAFLKAHLN